VLTDSRLGQQHAGRPAIAVPLGGKPTRLETGPFACKVVERASLSLLRA
jgi:hypothetical protein